jgi:polyribonucleotide nucleotidyltransferase
MFNIVEQEIELGNQSLKLSTGKLARQADGSVVAQMGDAIVHAVVVVDKQKQSDTDFFPLSVNYREMYYSAGIFPGGFIKREGKPSETEALYSRIIDRPLRPIISKDFFHETQIIVTLLSYDKDINLDVLSVIAASASLKLAGVPVADTVAASRVVYINDQFVLNPSKDNASRSDLDLLVAGTKKDIMMIESSGKEVPIDLYVQALEFAQKEYASVIDGINAFVKASGKKVMKYEKVIIKEEVKKDISEEFLTRIKRAFLTKDKQKRYETFDKLEQEAIDLLSEKYSHNEIKFAFKSVKSFAMRDKILKGKRIDGRTSTEIRDIDIECDILPRAHSSCLFTRGSTQSLGTVTLGTQGDEQIVDGISGDFREKFMLHYNFPEYSVGQVGPYKAPGRREIGHGRLAHKAILPVIPKHKSFPYTIRVVSEIMESNGSSSMATVCSASVALMNAGVPISSHVSGIAMGLIKENDKYTVLSDITGEEDDLGDMDFKVAGTKKGVTALQLDIKVPGISLDVIKSALSQAEEGRLFILNKMESVISKPKDEISKYAPQMKTIKISKDKVRELIGQNGRTIREISDSTRTKIDANEEGIVTILGPSIDAIIYAEKKIYKIVGELPVEQNALYRGKVTKVMEAGINVNIGFSSDIFVYAQDISESKIENLGNFIKENDTVIVRYLGMDKGRQKFTMKI